MRTRITLRPLRSILTEVAGNEDETEALLRNVAAEFERYAKSQKEHPRRGDGRCR